MRSTGSLNQTPLSLSYEAIEIEIPGAVGRPLSRSERVIYWMLKNAHERIVPQIALWNALYSVRPECEWADDNIIRVFISKLRKKLPRVQIQCHNRIGYSLHEVENEKGDEV